MGRTDSESKQPTFTRIPSALQVDRADNWPADDVVDFTNSACQMPNVTTLLMEKLIAVAKNKQDKKGYPPNPVHTFKPSPMYFLLSHHAPRFFEDAHMRACRVVNSAGGRLGSLFQARLGRRGRGRGGRGQRVTHMHDQSRRADSVFPGVEISNAMLDAYPSLRSLTRWARCVGIFTLPLDCPHRPCWTLLP